MRDTQMTVSTHNERTYDTVQNETPHGISLHHIARRTLARLIIENHSDTTERTPKRTDITQHIITRRYEGEHCRLIPPDVQTA